MSNRPHVQDTARTQDPGQVPKQKSFKTLEEFYQDDVRRRISPEADYGVHWRDGQWSNPWRVSYVQKTGEVYAINNGNHNPGPVRVLGTVPADPEPDIPKSGTNYYRTLDRILDRYPDHCGPTGGLQWVEKRLREYNNRDQASQGQDSSEAFDPNRPIYSNANAQNVLEALLEHLMGDHDGDYPDDSTVDALAPRLKGLITQTVQQENRTPCDHIYMDIENLAHNVQELLTTNEVLAIRKFMGL